MVRTFHDGWCTHDKALSKRPLYSKPRTLNPGNLCVYSSYFRTLQLAFSKQVTRGKAHTIHPEPQPILFKVVTCAAYCAVRDSGTENNRNKARSRQKKDIIGGAGKSYK